MNCYKCGAMLDDDAVFCDKCGSFVLNETYSLTGEIKAAGKRVRNRSSFWLFFKIFAVVVIVISGIAGVIIGYTYISRDTVKYNDKPYQSNSEIWGDSLVIIPSLSTYYEKIKDNPYDSEKYKR